MNDIVTAQAKDNVVIVRYTKTDKGISARVSFIDQFGAERALFLPEGRSDASIRAVESVLNGHSRIFAPDNKSEVKNAYET